MANSLESAATMDHKLLSGDRPYVHLAAALLLAGHLALIHAFAAATAPTIDEPVHIQGGANILLRGNHTVDPTGGTLTQIWLALPCKLRELAAGRHAEGNSHFAPALDCRQLVNVSFHNEGRGDVPPPGSLLGNPLLQARMMTALLSVALGVGIYLFALSFLSGGAALSALLLYSTHPVMISNGALATADVAGGAAFFFGMLFVWRLLRRATLWRILAAGLALGCLFLAKMSAVLALPTIALLVASRALSRYPLRARLPFCPPLITSKLGKAVAMCLGLGGAFLVVWAMVWSAHGFRYSMADWPVDGLRPIPMALFSDRDGHPFTLATPPCPTGKIDEATAAPGIIAKGVRLAARWKILPESYLYGFAMTVKYAERRLSFFRGRHSETGHLAFFPYLFLVKNPLGTLALFCLGAGCLLVRRERRHWLPLLPFLLFSSVYLFFALRSGINIGIRHLIPIFPVVFLVCGVAADKVLRLRRPLWLCLLCLFMVCAALEPLSIHPSYLAYFNCLDGDPAKAYRKVVDSSLDWGQDIVNLRKAFAEQGLNPDAETLYFSYFGVCPTEVAGVRTLPLPGFSMGRADEIPLLKPGYYCVSASMLQGINAEVKLPQAVDPEEYRRLDRLFQEAMAADKAPGGREKFIARHGGGDKVAGDLQRYAVLRFERLRLFLLQREPDFSAGYSILVYKLSAADLAAATQLH